MGSRKNSGLSAIEPMVRQHIVTKKNNKFLLPKQILRLESSPILLNYSSSYDYFSIISGTS
jgi:hypothetical protein